MLRSFGRAKKMIKDLEHHGPASIIHLIVLSAKIERPIYVWNNDGTLYTVVGKEKTGNPVDVEYHTTDPEQTGHWTLKHGKDPTNVSLNLNSCLFSVIGSQIGQDPSTLRGWTLVKLMSNFRHLDAKMKKILQLGKNGRKLLLIGGARYCGTSIADAKQILDYSQNNFHHPLFLDQAWIEKGHPRGHAYLAENEREEVLRGRRIDDICTVESYSKRDTLTTAFLSWRDQDFCAHLALRSQKAQDIMRKLNTLCKTEPKVVEEETSTCSQSTDISKVELEECALRLGSNIGFAPSILSSRESTC
ncbi:uncharacterized protein LOC109858196 isoform X2 [Pseudomyrmex gracilis]|uniref:uncharacterized protein LOC109858196 isoform X2 n=1 Tax=Pseudomyrmex gracilis TaxID=219809 RepID=UPI000994EE9A|nr:uncharacterized protein LOC109858196 isoform X2 [Pseudomyrmex gracilis]